MTHDKIIEVVKAHKEGRVIEVFSKTMSGVEKWSKHNVCLSCLMADIARGKDFRIKPEPKYRPYQTADEVPVGRVVITETGGKFLIVRAVELTHPAHSRLEVTIGIANYTPKNCLDRFKFEDGLPCGILVKESNN